MRLTVRRADRPDHEAILDLVGRAFSSRDHDGNEEVQIVLDTWRSGAVVPGLELVAVDDGLIVGHVLGARGRPGSPAVVGVAPLCVDPSRHGLGVGTALMSALLDEAENQHWPAVVVLGDPGYYGRFGFEPAGRLGVVYEPAGEGSLSFQLRRLPAFDASVRGLFRYCWET